MSAGLLTTRQLLADLSADYDLPKIILRAHEVLEGVTVDAGRIVVTVTRYRTRETRTELQFTHRGTLMRHWTVNPDDGTWREGKPMMVWDDDFTAQVVLTWSRRTPAERADSHMWAALCARPGTDRTPLLSWHRVAHDDPRTHTDAIRQHWTVTDYYMTQTEVNSH